MKKYRDTGSRDTERQGREPNELKPLLDEIAAAQPEPPMDSDDATGAPPGIDKNGRPSKRYKREMAFKAWTYIARHDPALPLPHWVAEYLTSVAPKIVNELGPRGSLSPASAHSALGLVGVQWPEHHPNSVYSIINAWVENGLVDGRKAGAVKYIEEYMGNDREVPPDRVIEWYRNGQKAFKE
jgi:hypothetical protein